MRAPISVVIPTLNAEAALATCLQALYQGVQAGLIRELIVVDGGSTDDTVLLAREAGAEVLEVAPSRGGQLQAGCARARGDWILALHADSVLQDGWADVVAAHLGAARPAACFRLRFDDTATMARITACWANLRSRWLGLPFGDQGLLMRRDMYLQSGGYADQPLMEDIALVRALPGRVRLLDARVTTNADRYRHQGWARRGACNLWLQLRFLCGAAPENLARSYERK